MKEKIVYIQPESSTFTRKDIRLLSEKYRVVAPVHNWTVKSMTPINFLLQFLFLTRHICSCKSVLVMFGGYWSFLPALFGKITGKPVYIIPGGTDCVSFPSLKYGSLRKPLLKVFIKWSFMMAAKLVPVDESLIWSEYHYHAESDYDYQGFKFFFPRLRTPVKVIHNGYDPSYFKFNEGKRVHNSFITVASASNMVRYRVKGIDLVVWLASVFTDCGFTIIGISDSLVLHLKDMPSNVRIVPFVDQDRLREYLAETQFVLQLSVSEGFPNALCEAMLSGCIPVGSAVGAIPAIIGDTGYVMDSSDKEVLKRKFGEIICTDEDTRKELSRKARTRITEHFHISFREKALIQLIETGS